MDGSSSLAGGKDWDLTSVAAALPPPPLPQFYGLFLSVNSLERWLLRQSVSSPGIPSFSRHGPLPKASCLAQAYAFAPGRACVSELSGIEAAENSKD